MPVHAACLANSTGAYLFAGSSGTGKTTICLDLIEDGYDLMGDNYTLLSEGRVHSFLSPLNIFTYNLAPSVSRRISRRTLTVLKVKGLLWKATGGYVKIFTKINPAHLWPEQTSCVEAIPKAVFFLVKGDSFGTSPVSPQSLARALVANMRLEIPQVLEWLAQYSTVNRRFVFDHWLARYEDSLVENLLQVPRLLRVEIPRVYDLSTKENIRALVGNLQCQ